MISLILYKYYFNFSNNNLLISLLVRICTQTTGRSQIGVYQVSIGTTESFSES